MTHMCRVSTSLSPALVTYLIASLSMSPLSPTLSFLSFWKGTNKTMEQEKIDHWFHKSLTQKCSMFEI